MTRVHQLVIDAPERGNALSFRVLETLLTELTSLDGSVVGIVLSGRGATFSAGADFEDLTGTSADLEYDDAVAELTRTIRELSVVVIAAVEGPCIGAGADLALSCDLRIAAEGSYLQIPAVRLGLLYNPETVRRLGRAYPRDTIRRLLLLGERFDAQSALQAGLVSEVVRRGDAVRHATDLLRHSAAGHAPAIAATKAFLNEQEAGEVDATLWQVRRRALLDSPSRKAAVDHAKRLHTEKEG